MAVRTCSISRREGKGLREMRQGEFEFRRLGGDVSDRAGDNAPGYLISWSSTQSIQVGTSASCRRAQVRTHGTARPHRIAGLTSSLPSKSLLPIPFPSSQILPSPEWPASAGRVVLGDGRISLRVASALPPCRPSSIPSPPFPLLQAGDQLPSLPACSLPPCRPSEQAC